MKWRSISIALISLTAVIAYRSGKPTMQEQGSPAESAATSDAVVDSASVDQNSKKVRRAARPEPGIFVHERIEQAPTWTVRYGQETWRRPAPDVQADTAGEPGGLQRNFNLGDVIARVSHAIRRSDESAHPQGQAKSFATTFDGQGFRMALHRLTGMEADTSAGAAVGSGDPNDPLGGPPATRYSARFEPDPTTEAVFRTKSVEYGGSGLYAQSGEQLPWSVLGNTAQGLLNEQLGLIEHYEQRDEGVEVTWVLNQRPAASGSMQITAELTGLSYLGQSDDGHHFADASGTSRLRVGHATAVDAAGSKIEVPINIKDTVINLQVPEQFLTQAQFPIAIDPVIGPEYGMGVCMETNQQSYPSVGSDGTTYLVAWVDTRNCPVSGNIYGARVNSSGMVLDPTGIAICTNTNGQGEPTVAGGPNGYYVAWIDFRNMNTTSGVDVYGTRVSSGGSVLDSGGVALSLSGGAVADGYQYEPRATASSSAYFVVWTDDRIYQSGSSDVYGARVSTNGSVLDSTSIAVFQGGDHLNQPHGVASDGSDYLVAWYYFDLSTGTNDGLYVTRVTGSGTVQDANGVRLHEDAYRSAIAYAASATNYLVIFNRSPYSDMEWTYGNRVTTGGGVTVLDGYGIGIQTNDFASVAGLASNGTNFLAVYHPSYSPLHGPEDVAGRRVRSSDGALLDTVDIQIAEFDGIQFLADVASNGRDFLAVWQQDPLNDGCGDYSVANDVYGARITAAGVTLDLIPISTIAAANNKQTYPNIASSGNEYFVVWEDDRNTSTNSLDIYGTVVGRDGFARFPCGIEICKASGLQERPAIASTAVNGNYLVAWMDKRGTNYDIYAARVDAYGIVAETNGFAVSTAAKDQSYPTVASAAGAYLVAWQDTRNASGTPDIYGSRVDGDGAVLDASGFAISTAANPQRFPHAAGLGTNYLVAWLDRRNVTTDYDIYAARVTTNAAVLDASGIAICTVTNTQFYPAVATDGTDYFVVWQDNRTSGADIYGSRITAGGTVLDSNGFPISTAAAVSEAFPTAAWMGTNYLVVWQDTRNNPYYPDIYGARVTSSASVVDTSGFAIDVGSYYQLYPRVATSGSEWMLVYQSAISSTNRVVARVISP